MLSFWTAQVVVNQRAAASDYTGVVFMKKRVMAITLVMIFSGLVLAAAGWSSLVLPGRERAVFAEEALTATVTPSATASPTLTVPATEMTTGTPDITATATLENTVTPANTPEATASIFPTSVGTPTVTTTPVPGATLLPPRSYRSAPADLPSFYIEQRQGEFGDGYLFVSMFNRRIDRESYHLILDNDGDLVYYQPLDLIPSSNDFKKQPNGLLSYFSPVDGDVTYDVMNNNYEVVRQIRAVDDPETGEVYTIDNHGLQLLENGNALFMIHARRVIDLSAIIPGGNEEAVVIGCVIQEVDKNNNLVFQWRSWDHIGLPDTFEPFDRDPLRYTHCNSVEVDRDGNLLVSFRNLHEVTKIDRQTGEIIWRMGGRQNEFEFLNDDGFTIQHDARRLADGHITLYDNGDARADDGEGVEARGVEYVVDEGNKTVEMVAEFRNIPQTYAKYMGNVQRLPNGNTFIGWGSSSAPVLTEFDGNGDKILEFKSMDNMFSYRAFRFPWRGFPLWPPQLAAYSEGDEIHLAFSWNGSTETASYYIDSGRDPGAMSTLAWVTKTGFETTFSREMAGDGIWYFRVRPINNEGVAGPASNIVRLLVGGESTYLPLVGGGEQ
jgi:hypothetical protein